MVIPLCLLIVLALNLCETEGAKIGQQCTPDNTNAKGNCEGNNILCTSVSGDHKCTCESGFDGADGGECTQIPANKIGAECSSETCAGNNVQCADGASSKKYCTCKDGFDADPGATGCDTVVANRIGGTCTTTPASCATNAECSAANNGVCKCKPGFKGSTGDADCTQIPANKVGAECTSDTCEGNNVQCAAGASSKKYCTCKDGFTAVPGAPGCDTRENGGTHLFVSPWLLSGSIVALLLTICLS